MKENQRIEWKESWRDEYLRWICGFANAEGGALHIGRNDRGAIANAFFRAGQIEAWGRGIQRVSDACREAGIPQPLIDYRPGDFWIEFPFASSYLDVIPEVTPEVTPEVKRMLELIQGEMGRREIQSGLGLADEKHFREYYQQPAIALGLIEMTIPGKPRSSRQKYRLTRKGRAALSGSGRGGQIR